MKGDEEFEALKEQRDLRKARQPNENSACLVAVCDTKGMRVRDTYRPANSTSWLMHHACMGHQKQLL